MRRSADNFSCSVEIQHSMSGYGLYRPTGMAFELVVTIKSTIKYSGSAMESENDGRW
jgi:hypothetical protein